MATSYPAKSPPTITKRFTKFDYSESICKTPRQQTLNNYWQKSHSLTPKRLPSETGSDRATQQIKDAHTGSAAVGARADQWQSRFPRIRDHRSSSPNHRRREAGGGGKEPLSRKEKKRKSNEIIQQASLAKRRIDSHLTFLHHRSSPASQRAI